MNPLLKFVAKQLFGQKGVIANNKAVNFEAAKLAEKLSEFGIDPSSIKTEKQLEGIINQIKELQKKRMAESMEVISQDDPRFKGIMDKMMGSNVIKRDFGKPFKEEIKKMETEAEIAERIAKDNKKGIANIRKKQKMLADAIDDASPGFANDIKVDAELVAENLAERMGLVYDDLPTKERLDIYDQAYTGLSKQRFKNMPKPDPEEKADGGRIGYKLGTFKKIGEGVKSFAEFLNKKNPVQAYTDYLKSIKDKTLKANKTGKFTDLPLAEVGIPAAGGMLINRAVKKKLEAMSKEDVERKKERDDKADGGRIGFKKGMDRRTFMKMVGGLTALPILGKFFKGTEVAAPVAEKVVEAAKGAPPYFFNLVDRIRALGTKSAGPKERSEFFRYKDYEMDIDYDTGVIEIKKTKEAMIPGGDEAGVSEEVYMTYKPGRGDEATKGTPADEYEEFTAKPDIDGKMKDVEEGVPDEVIEEGSIGKEQLEQEIVEQIARDKKASGGIAMMLGE